MLGRDPPLRSCERLLAKFKSSSPRAGNPRYLLAQRPVEQDDLVYLLCRALRATRVAGFATSLPSTSPRWCGANGGATVIGSGIAHEKVAAAQRNLAAAGLLGLVDIRTPDARRTLKDLGGRIDLALIDGWPTGDAVSLERQVIEGCCAPGAPRGVGNQRQRRTRLFQEVRDPDDGFRSPTLPLERSTELSAGVEAASYRALETNRSMATPILEPTSPRPRPRFRMLEVRGVERLTPRMMRVTLGGPELEGFENPAPTQHVKLIIPEPGQTSPTLPDPSVPRGAVGPDGRRPSIRTFTVRRLATTPGKLQIDFVLHGDGPASRWAERAEVGGLVAVAGPGGRRYAIDAEAQHYLFIGDETALPAIGTMLEALPSGAHADVYAEVDGPDNEVDWATATEVCVTWLHRSANGTPVGDGLLTAVREAKPLDHWDRVWLACEATVMRRIRKSLLEERQLAQDHIVTRGYWKVGEANYADHDYGQD